MWSGSVAKKETFFSRLEQTILRFRKSNTGEALGCGVSGGRYAGQVGWQRWGERRSPEQQ